MRLGLRSGERASRAGGRRARRQLAGGSETQRRPGTCLLTNGSIATVRIYPATPVPRGTLVKLLTIDVKQRDD